MKTKKEIKTNTSRIIFFTIALTYNLILAFYLRDFLVLSPTLQVFYLLSVLPTLFLAVEMKTKAMRSTVYISLILISCMNIAYAIYCRRVFPILAIISLGIVFMYFVAFANTTQLDVLDLRPITEIVTKSIIGLEAKAAMDKYGIKADIIIGKNRHGRPETVRTAFFGDYSLFDNLNEFDERGGNEFAQPAPTISAASLNDDADIGPTPIDADAIPDDMPI